VLRLRRFAATLSMNGPFPLVLSVAQRSRRMSETLTSRHCAVRGSSGNPAGAGWNGKPKRPKTLGIDLWGISYLPKTTAASLLLNKRQSDNGQTMGFPLL